MSVTQLESGRARQRRGPTRGGPPGAAHGAGPDLARPGLWAAAALAIAVFIGIGTVLDLPLTVAILVGVPLGLLLLYVLLRGLSFPLAILYLVFLIAPFHTIVTNMVDIILK